MELKEFKITVLPLRAKLLNYARKLTDEPEDAEDAVQEVLLKLWNKRLELEQYRSIEAICHDVDAQHLYRYVALQTQRYPISRHSAGGTAPPEHRNGCWKSKMKSV